MIVVGADWLFHRAPRPPATLDSAGLGLLPLVASIVGFGVAFLPKFIRVLVPAIIAFRLGDLLGDGRRARTLPLSTWWPVIAAIGVVAGAALSFRGLRRRRSRSILWSTVGFAAVAVAVFVQPGRYGAAREMLVALAIAAFFAALPPMGGERRRRWTLAMLVVVLFVGGFGIERGLRSDRAVDWIVDHTATTEVIVRRLRRTFASSSSDTGFELDVAPFFGTPIATESRRRLGDGRGPRGVLLITVDAMRADMIGRVVDGRAVTPNLDRVMPRACRFTRAYVPAPGSQLSLYGFLAGLYPNQLLAYPGSFNDVPLITEGLEGAGIATRACYARGVLSLRDRDFDRFALGFGESRLHAWDDPSAEEIVAAIRPEPEDERWFSYVHLLRPHYPYGPVAKDCTDCAAPAGANEFSRYAAEVRHCDHVIQIVLDALAAIGELDDTLVIVSADHGEEFKEHGSTRHGTNLFDTSIHVPMIVFGPGVKPGEITTPVSLVDLAPTLVHAFDLSAAAASRHVGRSLVPFFVGMADPARLDFVISEIPLRDLGAHEVLSALIGPRYKLIVDERLDRRLLFNIENDPAETKNLRDEHPDVVRRETARLRAMQRSSGHVDVDRMAKIDPATSLRRDGGRMTPIDVLGQFRRSDGELPADLVIRSLLDYCEPVRNHQILAELMRRTETHSDAQVVLARQVVTFLRRGSSTSDRDDILGVASTVTDPDLQAAILEVFGRVADTRLAATANKLVFPAPASDALLVDLATARYRKRLQDVAPSSKLLAVGLAHDDVRIRRHAAQLGAETGVATVDDLVAAWSRSDERRLRRWLVAALGRAGDDARIDAILNEAAESGVRRVRADAIVALARRGDAAMDVRLLRDGRTDGVQGLVPVDANFHTFAASRATLGIRTWPSGTILALLIHPVGGDDVVVELACDGWRRLVAVFPTLPQRPALFMLPNEIQTETLRLRVTRGDPRAVRVGGVITRPLRPGVTVPLDERRLR